MPEKKCLTLNYKLGKLINNKKKEELNHVHLYLQNNGV